MKPIKPVLFMFLICLAGTMNQSNGNSVTRQASIQPAANQSANIGTLRYTLALGNENWPPEIRAQIVTAMDGAVALYNQVGHFDKELTASYSPGTPTADASYDGRIRFGGQIGKRTALHEIGHTLGVGTTRQWTELLVEGKWTGEHAIALLKSFDGPDAILKGDRQHFWPYGLNNDKESGEENDRRHVQMVAAFRLDMGLDRDVPKALPTSQPVEAENPNPPRHIAFVGDTPVELEVVRAKTGHLLVKPKIDGKDVGLWFFDTGAGINCIDKTLADELKLAVLREGKATGMGGETATRYRAIESLTLGPILLEGSEAIELDLSSFETFLGYKISGIIGHDTFFAGVFEIDHRNGHITAFDPSKYELKDAEWVEMKLLDRRPSVIGQLENNPPGPLMFDSGSNTGAIVTSPTVKAFDLLKDRNVKTSISGGVGGMQRRKSGILDEITIGNVHLKHVDTLFSQAVSGATASNTHQAILGIPILKQFVMIVNYPQMKLALKLNE